MKSHRFFKKTGIVPDRAVHSGWRLFGTAVLLLCFAVFQNDAQAVSKRDNTDSTLLPSCLIGLSLQETPGYVLVVEKSSQTLRVYQWNDGFSLKHTFPCSTGEVAGKKKKSGDRKTPEGVFFFTKHFKKRELSPTYGTRAFVMDYPNFMDRKQNRSGYNIWLHGTNKPLKPRDTNGCVAMKNRHLDSLQPYIRLNQTPIVIKEKLHMVPVQTLVAEQDKLTAFLADWNKTFTAGDKTRFKVFYEDRNVKSDSLWKTWDEIRPGWQSDHVSFDLTLENLAFMRSNPCVVAMFDQVAVLDKHAVRVGTRKLYLEPEKDSWKIVGEEYQSDLVSENDADPMAAALTQLEKLRKEYKTEAELVAEWADAWSSKDIKRYQACYAPDFYSQRKNLRAWIKYKSRLKKKYRKIKVVVEDLEISQNGDRATATFVQRYASDMIQSVGIKRLRLKRVNGLWKIYRETWRRI